MKYGNREFVQSPLYPDTERENSLGAYRFEYGPRQGKRYIGRDQHDRTRKIRAFFRPSSPPPTSIDLTPVVPSPPYPRNGSCRRCYRLIFRHGSRRRNPTARTETKIWSFKHTIHHHVARSLRFRDRRMSICAVTDKKRLPPRVMIRKRA